MNIELCYLQNILKVNFSFLNFTDIKIYKKNFKYTIINFKISKNMSNYQWYLLMVKS